MRLGRKFFYLFEMICGFLFLWLTGLLSGENVWLNSMSPVIYGRDVYISVSKLTESFSDGLIGSWAAVYAENHPDSESGGTGAAGVPVNSEGGQTSGDEAAQAVNAPVTSGEGMIYTVDMLKDYNYFVNSFYAIDSTTYAPDGLLDAENFMNMDLSIDLQGEGPKILIYHTHSQEAFADSRPGEWQDTVVGLGENLKNNLETRYGISVLHLTDTFDVRRTPMRSKGYGRYWKSIRPLKL